MNNTVIYKLLLYILFPLTLLFSFSVRASASYLQVCEVKAQVMELKEAPKPGMRAISLKLHILESKNYGDSRADCQIPSPPEQEITTGIPDQDDLLRVKVGARLLLQSVSVSSAGPKGTVDESTSWELLQVLK